MDRVKVFINSVEVFHQKKVYSDGTERFASFLASKVRLRLGRRQGHQPARRASISTSSGLAIIRKHKIQGLKAYKGKLDLEIDLNVVRDRDENP